MLKQRVGYSVFVAFWEKIKDLKDNHGAILLNYEVPDIGASVNRGIQWVGEIEG